MGKKQLLGLIGLVILFMSVFAPIISLNLPFNLGGSRNYFQIDESGGIIILILAGISFVLVLIKQYEGLWLAGIGSIGVMLYSFVTLQSDIGIRPNDLFHNSVLQYVHVQWGGISLIVGITLIIAGAVAKEDEQSKPFKPVER